MGGLPQLQEQVLLLTDMLVTWAKYTATLRLTTSEVLYMQRLETQGIELQKIEQRTTRKTSQVFEKEMSHAVEEFT
jgi:hypothetical protein